MSKSIKYFQNTLVVHDENNAHAYVDWGRFLKPEQNKANLFHFLAERVGSVATEGKQLCTTLENNIVYSFHINNVHDLTPCDHEEADTRIILHTVHIIVPSKDMIGSS